MTLWISMCKKNHTNKKNDGVIYFTHVHVHLMWIFFYRNYVGLLLELYLKVTAHGSPRGVQLFKTPQLIAIDKAIDNSSKQLRSRSDRYPADM